MCHRLLFVIEIRFDSSTAVTMWLRSVKMSCHAIATLAANFCFNRTSSTIDRRSLSGQVFSVMIVLFPSLPLENTGLYKKQIEISQMIERRLQLFSFFSHRDTRNTSIVDIQMTTTPFYTHESLCPLFWALLKKKKKTITTRTIWNLVTWRL